MTHVIYNVETTRLLTVGGTHLFKSARSAKIRLTKAIKSGHAVEGQWKIAELDDYELNIEKQVRVTHALTGEICLEPASTPWYCSVASESYWSM